MSIPHIRRRASAKASTTGAFLLRIKLLLQNSIAMQGVPIISPDGALICPRCNGKRVLRTSQRGPCAGNQFYGCSNYPQCKYIKNIEYILK